MIDVGKIVAAHGIKGEVKVLSLSSNPRRFQKGSEMIIEKTGQKVKIASSRVYKEMYIIGFEGIFQRNFSEEIKGSLLQIADEDVAPLPEGEYYLFELQGLTVKDEDGKILGTLTNLIENGANDVYRVNMEDGNYLLLPGIKQVIKKVDLKEKTMTVSLLPGLLEACTYHED